MMKVTYFALGDPKKIKYFDRLSKLTYINHRGKIIEIENNENKKVLVKIFSQKILKILLVDGVQF